MSDFFAQVAGHRIQVARVIVSARGPWIADLDFEDDAEVSGLVEIKLGTMSLHGTVRAPESGVFGLQRSARIVGGAGAWGESVIALDYANDAGVKARTVASDAARAVGENLGSFVPASERIGIHYARQDGPASRALEDVIGEVDWWVDYEGMTQVGTRAELESDPTFEVMAYNPRNREATLSVEDAGQIRVGTIIRIPDVPDRLVVRELEIRASPEELRVQVWCGQGPGKLQKAFRNVVERLTDRSLFGMFRYRVVRMSAGRVELQAVRKVVGLPNLLPISMWPGVSGCHAMPALGSECLVQFIEGSRTQPVVTHFVGKDGEGFEPLQLVLGGAVGPAAARLGDTVQVVLPPAAFSGTVGGSPATGTVTWAPPATADGVITSGSLVVQIK